MRSRHGDDAATVDRSGPPPDGSASDHGDADPPDIDLVVNEVTERTARGIAAAVNRLVTSGRLAVDSRLPTVRQVARALGVSPTTVSEAWRMLAAIGAVVGRGRQGTFVRAPSGPGAPVRYQQVTEALGHFTLDLSTGTPDPTLLPHIASVITTLPAGALTASYLDPAVLPDLEAHLVGAWPFVPEAFTMVDGAMDALDRISSLSIRMGDRVLVEDPTFPPLLDLLDHLGAEVIGIPMDAEGMVPKALSAALESGPVALICQLRAHNPTGISTTRRRIAQLAKIVDDTDVLLVEDDHSADIASRPLVSFGEYLPARTVHIRSFSKSHGPDLRLAAVGGVAEVVRAVANRRMLGPGWSSRILQAVLLKMLENPESIRGVKAASGEYARRRRAVCKVLDRRGVTYTGDDGINLWVQVTDERAAMLALAARGIGVAPGEPFQVAAPPRRTEGSEWIRVTIARAEASSKDIANLIADAAQITPIWG